MSDASEPTPRHPPTRPSAPLAPLPDAVEERAYEILLELPASERGRAFDALLRAEPSHHAALMALCRRLAGAEAALIGLGLSDAPSPERIGPYRLRTVLGEGGFGVVHLCDQAEPIRRQVALKLIRPGMDSAAVLRRFESERETLARFDHPCIAKVLDAGAAADGRPYLVTEYVPGKPITAYCADRRLSLRERLRLFVRVCDGVTHAHQRGVIHRDLKPSNVLVTDLDGEPWPKIIDFGIARAMEVDARSRATTRAGTLLGTPEYMSPEQAEGSEDVDLRTDVYALGVVLYELLVGDLPQPRDRWRTAGISDLVALIRTAEAPRPSTRTTDAATARRLRGDLDWIVLKALAKERDRRYASVAAFAADVTAFLEDRPVSAGPPRLWYQLRKFTRRHRVAVAAASLAVVALIVGLVVATSAWRSASRAESVASERLARFDALADVVRMRELRAAAERLWPARAETVAAYEVWLRDAAALLDGGAKRAAMIEALADAGDAEAFLRQALTDLAAEVRELDGEMGLVADVRRRLAFAREVRGLTVTGAAAQQAWARAAAAVAADPRLGGHRLTPIEGLLPIGADPRSGLEEFVVVQTGAAPVRSDDGTWRVDVSHGMVLVLVPGSAAMPGGVTRIGAQSRDAGGANFERELTAGQGEVVEVALVPYFVGKHEMTRAQWMRAFGVDPSHYAIGEAAGDLRIDALHPVEGLSWVDAARAMERLGLALPTDVQWEHACRAGSDTPWHTGREVESLQGFANLAGREASALAKQGIPVSMELGDAYLVTAPVGAFRPNAWGLHDVHGNLSEWCRDMASSTVRPRAGDGLREMPRPVAGLGDINAVLRGGSYADAARRARSSYRGAANVTVKNTLAGLRVAK